MTKRGEQENVDKKRLPIVLLHKSEQLIEILRIQKQNKSLKQERIIYVCTFNNFGVPSLFLPY